MNLFDASRPRYEDPLDVVWRGAAARIGLRVVRSNAVFASSDGRGTLFIAQDDLDPDDSLSQMVFHELCHSLVEGPERFEMPDWGLDNRCEPESATKDELAAEHAAIRLQAHLAQQWGLRRFLAPTTDHRPFFESLGADPLRPSDEESARRAVVGAARVGRPPWAPHLEDALRATAALAAQARAYAPDDSLWARVDRLPARHPTGGHAHAEAAFATCGRCAYSAPNPDGGMDCAARQTSVESHWEACEYAEPSLDCGRCGACCREAYHAVEIDPDDRFGQTHPELLVRSGARVTLKRLDNRCALLSGDLDGGEPYRCQRYAERPQTCRDFRRGGPHCFSARERLGLRG